MTSQITRRAALATIGAGAGATVVPVALSAIGTANPDQGPIGADAARWHQLEHQIDGALTERAKRQERLPDKFKGSIALDPRGATKAQWLSRILPGGQDSLAEYQDAYEAAGIGETNDWLNVLWAEQDQITERLLAARPQSLAEALALVGVGLKLLSGAVDAGDDYMVKVAKTAEHFLADAERLAGGAS